MSYGKAFFFTQATKIQLIRPELKVSYKGTLVREFIREARNLPMMKGDGMLSAGAALSSKDSQWQSLFLKFQMMQL